MKNGSISDDDIFRILGEHCKRESSNDVFERLALVYFDVYVVILECLQQHSAVPMLFCTGSDGTSRARAEKLIFHLKSIVSLDSIVLFKSTWTI